MDNEESLSCEWYDVSCGLSWLSEELKAIAIWVYDGILQGMVALVGSIPVPDFLVNVGTLELPSGVSYFADPFQLEWGVGIFVSAYVFRFLLRRIPVIG